MIHPARAKWRFVTAVVLPAMLATACATADSGGDASDANAAAGANSASEAELTGEPLRISLGHRILFDTRAWDAVARDQGFYDDSGVVVSDERVFPEGSSDAVQGIVSGSVDIAVGVGLFAVMSALQQGADLRIASAQYQGYGDIVFYAAGDSGVESLDDLAGGSIGISRPGSTTDMLAREMAAQIAAEGGDAPELVPTGSPPDTYTAVTTGQIDAGWTVPPFFFSEMEDGQLRRLFSGDDLDRYSGTTARVTLVRAEVLDERLADVQAFFDAYEQSLDWIFENMDEAVFLWADVAGLDNSAEELVAAVEDVYTPESLAIDELRGLDTIEEAAIDLEFLDGPLSDGALDDAIQLDEVLGS